jgi:hypothetical protein
MFGISRMPLVIANARAENVIKFKPTEEEIKLIKEKKETEPKKEPEKKKPIKRFEKDTPEAIEWGKQMAEKRKIKKELKEKQEDEDEKKLVMKKIAEQ